MSSLLPAPYRYILLVLTLALCGSAGVQAAKPTEVTHHEYDANGNPTLTQNPLGHTTRSIYDALDRPIRMVDPAGGQVDTTYDAADRPAAITDPLGHVTRYTYNGFGEVLRLESPDSGTTTNTYDAAGNLTASTDARGLTTRYAYDALNRLTRIDFAAGEPVIRTYDQGANGKGRLTGLRDGISETLWTYDVQGRVSAKTVKAAESTLTLRYTYDGNGRLQTLTYPSGQTIGYSWANGQVTGLSLNGVILLDNIRYRPFGPPAAWTWGNGAAYSRDFDLDGRLTSFALGTGERQLGYDAAGRILAYTGSDPAFDQNFSYDALDRLLSAAGPSGDFTYTYDANGNRLSRNGLPYVYAPDSNRLIQAAASYTYDAAGNVLSDGTNQFSYDARGRLAEVRNSQGVRRYQYDGSGARIAKWQGSAPDLAGDVDRDGQFSGTDARKLVLMAQGSLPATYNADCNHDGRVTAADGTCASAKVHDQRLRPEKYNQSAVLFAYDEAGHLIGEYTRRGQVLRETVWLGDQPVAALIAPGQPGAGTYYVHADHLGTPRALVEPATGRIVWRWDGEPFGASPAEQDPDGDGTQIAYLLRFPGQYYDAETGLHYNYFRNYDPGVGGYIESDPIGLAAGQFSTYTYVNGNPLSHTDSTGLFLDEAAMQAALNGVATTTGVAVSAVASAVVGVAALAYPTSAGEGSDITPKAKECDSSNDCAKLVERIIIAKNGIARRFRQLAENAGGIDQATHWEQLRGRQRNLRKLLNEAATKGCQVPWDAWYWASK